MTDVQKSREAIVAEAQAWIRTPYHHEAAVKGVGCDCATFPHEVFIAVGRMSRADLPHYPPDWMLHADDDRYAEMLIKAGMRELPAGSIPQAGDYALFKFAKAFSHGGIVTSWPQLIHSSRTARLVTPTNAEQDGELHYREVRFFSFFAE